MACYSLILAGSCGKRKRAGGRQLSNWRTLPYETVADRTVGDCGSAGWSAGDEMAVDAASGGDADGSGAGDCVRARFGRGPGAGRTTGSGTPAATGPQGGSAVAVPGEE